MVLSSRQPDAPAPVVLFDGSCLLCQSAVRFIIPRDPAGIFRFASLQSPAGRALLAAHHLPAGTWDTFYLLDGDRVFDRSDAALRIAGKLTRPWSLAAVFLGCPRGIRDGVYRFVARHRHRLMGRTDTCLVPTPEVRARFLS